MNREIITKFQPKFGESTETIIEELNVFLAA